MPSLPTIQPSLFGGQSVAAGYHVVSAHSRLLADGSEAFVGEHLRWNRGRSSRIPVSSPRPAEVPDEQLPLFGRSR